MGLENKLFQILLKGSEASAIVDDWVERNIECDLRFRKAKTKGHVVIERGTYCSPGIYKFGIRPARLILRT